MLKNALARRAFEGAKSVLPANPVAIFTSLAARLFSGFLGAFSQIVFAFLPGCSRALTEFR